MNKSERFFDKVSSKSKPEPDITASKIIDSSIAYLEKGNYVLDFGCGSGAITNKIAKEARAIDAIDISSGMLAFAKEQAEKASISNIDYIHDSIFDERFDNNKYDAIFAFNVLHYIDDIPRLINRINTLLQPNRVFTIEFPSKKIMDEFFSSPEYLSVKDEHFNNSVKNRTEIAMYEKNI